MSQRLSDSAVTGNIGGHPEEYWRKPLFFRKDGRPVFPIGGASPDDDSNGSGGSDAGTGDGSGSGSEGQQDNGDQGDGSGASGNKDEPKVVSQADYDKLMQRMQAADRNQANLQAKLKEWEEKDLSEQEKALKRVPELEQTLTQAQEENKKLQAKVAFLGASEYTWHDPDVALSQVDLSQVYKEDGTIDKKALKKAMEDLAKEKSFLVKSTADTKDDKQGGGGNGPSGAPVGSGKPNDKNKMDEASLRAKYPALN